MHPKKAYPREMVDGVKTLDLVAAYQISCAYALVCYCCQCSGFTADNDFQIAVECSSLDNGMNVILEGAQTTSKWLSAWQTNGS